MDRCVDAMRWAHIPRLRRFASGSAFDEPKRRARAPSSQEAPTRARPSRSRRRLEAEREGGSGSVGLDGARPILADYLAMGAGRAAVPGATSSAAVSVAQRRPKAHDTAGGQRRPEAASAVRERRLVAAALQRREALSQPTSQTPSRVPVGHAVAHRSPDRMPLLFAESYVGHMERKRREGGSGLAIGDSGAQSLGVEQQSRENLLKSLRIQVLPWHRRALRVMLCRALLFHFFQDCRAVLGLRTSEPPLFLWEARRAQEHSTAGDVVPLVKYLAETELHIKFGPARSTSTPSVVTSEVAQRLRAERRQPAKRWGLQPRDLHEDAVMRIFLDGCLSWPRVRDLHGDAPEHCSSAETVAERLC